MKTWQRTVPKFYHADILRADMMLAQARAADLAGDYEQATALRDKAEAIYQRVEDAVPANLWKETE